MQIQFLIVSYGSRKKIIDKTITSIKSINLNFKISIHLNSPDDVLLNYCKTVTKELYVSSKNIGSSGAFKNLIERCKLKNDCDFYILLDDDNCLDKQGMLNIRKILENLDKKRIHGMYRTNRRSHKDLIENGIDYSLFRINSPFSKNFAYFKNRLLVKKLQPKYKANYGIYGGLIIPSKVIAEIDSPDDSLVIYHDDYDFSRKAVKRIQKNILYIPDLKINDNETNLDRGFFDMTKSKTKDSIAYFIIRNPIKTTLRHDCNSKFIFIINSTIFFSMIILYCLIFSDLNFRKRITRIKVLLCGFIDAFGENSLFREI